MKNFSDLCREEIPQYKAYNKGFSSLTNVELVSLVINRGSGTRQSVEQARQILNVMDGSLRNVSKSRIEQLQVVQGIGDCKAIALQAAIELGRRFAEESTEQVRLDSAEAIYRHIRPRMMSLDHEEAYVLLMSNNFGLIKTVRISSGGITGTAVDIRQVVKEALVCNATVIALCHNHPSNNTTPSSNDNHITQGLQKACETMQLHFLDHVIVTDNDYYSYMEHGKI